MRIFPLVVGKSCSLEFPSCLLWSRLSGKPVFLGAQVQKKKVENFIFELLKNRWSHIRVSSTDLMLKHWSLEFSLSCNNLASFSVILWETRWPNGLRAGLRTERSGFGPVLCSSYFTLTVPLSTQEYKWVPATKCWGVGNLQWTSIPSRGVATFLVAYRYRDKLR